MLPTSPATPTDTANANANRTVDRTTTTTEGNTTEVQVKEDHNPHPLYKKEETDAMIYHVTVAAPTNIAVIKYWGKAADHANNHANNHANHSSTTRRLNTPLNDSLSVTLDPTDQLRAVTTVAASTTFSSDRLWVNGDEVDVAATTTTMTRFATVVQAMKKLARDRTIEVEEEEEEVEVIVVVVPKHAWQTMHIHVSSYNTFPTAAGLASSAAGYAALVFGLACLYNASETFTGEYSAIARMGSGSACRSLHGGFVAWRRSSAGLSHNNKTATTTPATTATDNTDTTGSRHSDNHNNNENEEDEDDPRLMWLHRTSIAEPIASAEHWPLQAMILVTNSQPKHVSSTVGMLTSVQTSTLLKHRVSDVVPDRMVRMQDAIMQRDFATFATLTMQDSNQFHAICLDTYPPIAYLNDVSKAVIQLVTNYNNARSGEIRCAYTFDAGPNAVLYFRPEHLFEIKSLIGTAFGQHLFNDENGNDTTESSSSSSSSKSISMSKASSIAIATTTTTNSSMFPSSSSSSFSGIERVIVTRVGGGPYRMPNHMCTIDLQTGLCNLSSSSSSSSR